jgi:hypothetical protein
MFSYSKRGPALMILAAAMAVAGFFSMSYNPKKDVLENIYKSEIVVINQTCFDEGGNVIASGMWVNPYKAQDCKYGLSIQYKSVIIFSSIMFFLCLYFFATSKSAVHS